MAACILAVAFLVLAALLHSRERRWRRQEVARRLRRAARERQWRSMIRGDDETGSYR